MYISKGSNIKQRVDSDVGRSFHPPSSIQPLHCILHGLDAHEGTDPHGIFPMFLKETRNEIAPKLAVISRLLIKSESFPWYWRTADVVPVSKDASCAKVSNNHPIYVTPILSKVLRSY